MRTQQLQSLKQVLFPKVWESDKYLSNKEDNTVRIDNRERCKLTKAHKRVRVLTNPIRISDKNAVTHTYVSSISYHSFRMKKECMEKRMKKLNLQQYFVPWQQIEKLFTDLWNKQLTD